MRILIANRGEIARRIIRTAHALGHETVAAYADPDATTPFVAEATMSVRIGPATLAESYLSVPSLLAAASQTGADAIHPGYGFLSESPSFARAVIAAGLTWIGPNPHAIDSMGGKIQARAIAAAAGVPTIPGWSDSQDPGRLRDAAIEIGFPILVKAAAGGGGKGIRIAPTLDDFDAALTEASTEARRNFGNGDVIVERFVTRPRHIEVQIIADQHGNCFDLGTRECSVQRRYQKLVEEAPAPNLPDSVRFGLRSAAVDLAKAVGYDSAGTVEFIVDADTWEWFFLEMNTRLQVEHPVTEEVTGLDLVALQIAAAKGDVIELPVPAELDRHAIEVRINAEDPSNEWAPQTGTVRYLQRPGILEPVRWDSGVVSDQEITPFYDPMIAKLIVSAETREGAIDILGRALDTLLIDGVRTNGDFHRWLLDQPEFLTSELTTRWLDEQELESVDEAVAAHAAADAWNKLEPSYRSADNAGPPTVWSALGSRRVTPHATRLPLTLRSATTTHHIRPPFTRTASAASVNAAERRVVVNVRGRSWWFEVPVRSDAWAPTEERQDTGANAVLAPFPAVVAEVNVAPGEAVTAGQILAVIEAMKMLHSMPALRDGIVAEVPVTPGQTVAGGDLLVRLEEAHENSAIDT